MTGASSLRVLAAPSGSGTDGNPYVDLLFRGVRASGVQVREFDRKRLMARAHVVHVQWPASLVRWDSAPQAAFDVVKVLGGLLLARLRGAKLVWTAHDLRPHELRRPLLHAVYFAIFIRMVDLWISLTESGAAQLRHRYPVLARRPLRVIAHGSYRPVHPVKPARADAERVLRLPPRTGTSFLLLGQLRRYKNAVPLIEAFARDARSGERLLIAGEARGDSALAGELGSAAHGRGDVVLRLGRVLEEDIARWHAATDVVVLPYDDRSALNSGALILALSLEVPVVVADSPVNRELQRTVGAGWIHLFRGGPADALAVARLAVGERPEGPPDLEAFAWPTVVRDTVAAYRDLVGDAA